MNKVILVGRLVKDPELRYTKNGKATTDFTIAVNREYKNENGEYETDFINVTAWGKISEATAEYCKKGDMIGLQGCLRHESYETEEGKKYKDYVLADKITFLSTKKEG